MLILPGAYPSARCAPRERGRAIFSRASWHSGVSGRALESQPSSSVEAEKQRAASWPKRGATAAHAGGPEEEWGTRVVFLSG